MRTNKTAKIKRLEAEAENPNIQSWVEKGTEQVFFIPLSDERRQLARAEGIIGKAYEMWMRVGADILETDRVEINEIEYDVKGIKKYEGSYSSDHLEVLIEERKQ